MKTNETQNQVVQFIHKYAVACGGNWGAVLMSAIQYGMPDVYDELDDNRVYEFVELWDIIERRLAQHENNLDYHRPPSAEHTAFTNLANKS